MKTFPLRSSTWQYCLLLSPPRLQCWGPQGLESTAAHCIQHSLFLVLNVIEDSVSARQVLSCWAVPQHNPKVEEVDLMCLSVRASLCCPGWPGIHARASSTPWVAGGIGMHHHARLHNQLAGRLALLKNDAEGIDLQRRANWPTSCLRSYIKICNGLWV